MLPKEHGASVSGSGYKIQCPVLQGKGKWLARWRFQNVAHRLCALNITHVHTIRLLESIKHKLKYVGIMFLYLRCTNTLVNML